MNETLKIVDAEDCIDYDFAVVQAIDQQQSRETKRQRILVQESSQEL